MKHLIRFMFTMLLFAGVLHAETNSEIAVRRLEDRIKAIEERDTFLTAHLGNRPFKISTSTPSLLAFFVGCFCALWAQNNNRSAWLWFFMGLIFAPITVIVMLVKNGTIRREERLARISS